ncbi:MAG: hypothetical protein K0B16_17840, partial [Burkholderiaceae bacterium]|nr:hypothetical protein [Burkholderiaceae bacterium]
NPQFETRMFRFTYSSPVTPSTVFDYDMKRRLRHLRKFSEVRGGFDPRWITGGTILNPAASRQQG